ncbi:c-type cytochrome [uncultured Hymenobacter sp.]|uniref:c-type cytochrome n=1 Tax=uncultured Hymenobacter sp. TaxID=170016 RepID=UPI0035CB627C
MKNFLPLAAALLLAPAAQAAAPAPTPPLTGKVLYARNCARCHGPNGRLGLNGAHDLTKSNLNAFGRTYLVTNGMGKMPSFQKQLTPPQIAAVVAYSLTLK